MHPLRFPEPMLRPLADESFFSLCSRHHQLWGSPTSAKTTELLFGHRRRGSQHDFPSELNSFVQRTGGILGTTTDLAIGRTLLAYYRPFLIGNVIDDAVAAMASGSVAHLKYRLGLLTSRFRANHPLKACVECICQDVAEHGWAYWHLSHQFPGVWVCPQHGCLLRVSILKSTGVERFQWCLPLVNQLRPPSEHILSGDAMRSFSRLSSFTLDVNRMIPLGDGLTADSVQRACRQRMAEKGWVTSGGNLRLDEMAFAFLPYASHLRSVQELEPLPSDRTESVIQFGRLLRPMRSGTHPLRWMVLASWLFEGAAVFLSQARAAQAGLIRCVGQHECDRLTPEAGLPDARRAGRDKVVQMIRDGSSSAFAAHEAGVSIQTAMAWAAQAGIPSKRRPKQLVQAKRELIVEDLLHGMTKEKVAAQRSVSIQMITRVLQTEVGLHAVWASKRLECARQQARHRWLDLKDAHGALGVKFMRSLEPAAYAWLYRNDRAWLREQSPERVESRMPRRSSVKWDERDLVLRGKVREAIVQLVSISGNKLIQLWEVVQLVPGLKAKLRALDRLPLTREALQQAIVRRTKLSSSQASRPF